MKVHLHPMIGQNVLKVEKVKLINNVLSPYKRTHTSLKYEYVSKSCLLLEN